MYKVLSAFSKSLKSFSFQVNPLNFAFPHLGTTTTYTCTVLERSIKKQTFVVCNHDTSVMARPKERNERNSSKNAAAMVKYIALMTSPVSFQSSFPLLYLWFTVADQGFSKGGFILI